MDYILQARQLTKQFADKIVVDHLDLAIAQGCCFGLLGPNGAGKTTTIEMLEGLLAPDQGDVLFNGKVRDQTFRQSIGIQFQHTALQDHMSVKETLILFAQLYQAREAVERLMTQCQLHDIAHQDTHQLSGGQRQRLLLAISLINDPQLLFLDEPTTGLDPQSRQNFWQLIEQVKADGKSVLLTTHYMDEAHYLCDEIGIIDQGQLIVCAAPNALLNEHLPGSYLSVNSEHSEVLTQLGISFEYYYGGCRWKSREVAKQLELLLAAGLSYRDIQLQRPNLEDLFIKLTGRQLRS